MAQGNGKTPTLEKLREQTDLVRAQTEYARARQEQQVVESFGQLNFGMGWSDLLNPWQYRRDPFGQVWLPLGQGGVGARRDGRDLPFVFSDSDLDGQRALARWLTKKNDLAIGALSTLRNFTIKKGYKWEAHPAQGYEQDERVVALAKQVQRVIDVDSDLNKLPQRERSAHWRACRDGEALVRHFAQADGTTRHRFVSAEQLRDPGHLGPIASFGIETDEDDVETVLAYHVTYDGTNYDRVPPEEISHLKRNVDEEIKRGVSDFYSAGETFDEVQKLLSGMRRGGALLSKIAYVEQFKNTTGSQISAHQGGLRDLNRPQIEHPATGRRVDQQTMLDGTIVRMGENKEFKDPPLAGNTTNFTAIIQACLRAAGVRWCMPENIISGDASNNNYASILVAGAPFVNFIECEQDDFGMFFLRWRWVAIRNACERGLIDAAFEEVERLIDVKYTPPQVAVANQQQEADIDHKDIEAGVLSLQTRRARRGLDDEQERHNLKEEPLTRVQGRATDLDQQGNPVPMQGQQGAGLFDSIGRRMGRRAARESVEVDEESLSPHDEAVLILLEAAQRKVGEKWQGPSGRWFTKNAEGHVVPAKGPGEGEPTPADRGKVGDDPKLAKMGLWDRIKAAAADLGFIGKQKVKGPSYHEVQKLSVADRADNSPPREAFAEELRTKKEQVAGWEVHAQRTGQTVDEAKKKAVDKANKLITALKPAIRLDVVGSPGAPDVSRLEAILDSGVYKNQHWPGNTSKRALNDRAFRRVTEEKSMGAPPDTPYQKTANYGYMSDPDYPPRKDSVHAYGGVILRLKPSVRERSTYSIGDSLMGVRNGQFMSFPEGESTPECIDGETIGAGGDEYLDSYEAFQKRVEQKNTNTKYIEIQVHDGLPISDIESLEWDSQDGEMPSHIKQKLDSLGIPYKVY